MEDQGRDLPVTSGESNQEADIEFYQKERDMVNRQTGRFNSILDSIERIVDASHDAGLLPHNRPSSIPREDFLMDELPASVVRKQLETAKRNTIHHKKSVEFNGADGNLYKRFKEKNITLTALNDEAIHPDEREGNPLVLSITSTFERRKVTVTMDAQNKVRVSIEFPKRKADKHPLQYRFKPLPLTGNTQEEGFLTLYLMRLAYLEMCDPSIEGEKESTHPQIQ